MFGTGYDSVDVILLSRTVLAIFLMGFVIKLLDDFLDLRYDVMHGYEGLAVRLGEGTLPYALILFTLSVIAQSETALCLMVAAYIVGMAGEYTRPLPSGLKGYQEGAIILIVAFLMLPWSDVLWAVSLMFGVQAIDDLVDFEADRISGNPNLARKIGIVELHLAGLMALCLAASLRPVSTAILCASVPVVLAADQRLARPLPRRRGWGL